MEHNGEEIAVDKNRLDASALVVEQVVTVIIMMAKTKLIRMSRRGVLFAWQSWIRPRRSGMIRRLRLRLQQLLLQAARLHHRRQQQLASKKIRLLLQLLRVRARHLHPRTSGQYNLVHVVTRHTSHVTLQVGVPQHSRPHHRQEGCWRQALRREGDV